ncbi:unnamed protein product [Microthlaspi erraticum]|uniref:Uncharacterized protein n=1 Tax=Microthlaspi erraticum TaxID=1685480 RepID=A0A6D2I993_9BRAS|nr:unnamed protein product [Microthlaspi erraticum]
MDKLCIFDGMEELTVNLEDEGRATSDATSERASWIRFSFSPAALSRPFSSPSGLRSRYKEDTELGESHRIALLLGTKKKRNRWGLCPDGFCPPVVTSVSSALP